MKNTFILLFFFLFFVSIAQGQRELRADFEKTNPIDKNASLTFEQKVGVHQRFLDKSKMEKDTLHQFYALLYFVKDYLMEQDYIEVANYLLEAEKLADAMDNETWKGWVVYRKGVLSLRLKNFEEALQQYEVAASHCGAAGDSLCLAESLEQASAMYGLLADFDNAVRVHDLAMPLLEKFGGEQQLGAVLNNFGIIHSLQGLFAESIPYFEQAIAIHKKLGLHKEEGKALNNLADAYCSLGRYDRAEEIYLNCIQINQEYQNPENLLSNFIGLSELYDSVGNYRAGNIFLEKHYDLKDSLIGVETQQKIAELEIKYETQQKELALEKSKSALYAAQTSVERRNWFIVTGLLIAAFGIWRWRLQTLQANREQLQNQEKLADLTRILLNKNKRLADLEGQVLKKFTESPTTSPDEGFEANLFDQHILTDADWAAFKTYFEKAHPGYLQRLRSAFPSLTDAEERLFLFIKLKLNTKEAAAILGISPDSVKKTRNRLRKRLELGEETNLEDFILAF